MYLPLNDELGGRTLGVIGLGASGKELARRAAALGMRVIAVDVLHMPDDVLRTIGVDWCGGPERRDELLREADYVSLHVPLTSETRHLIDRRALALMKPSAVLVNVARGAVVDDQALIEALASGRLRGACTDVFADEPVDPRHPLLHLERVIATPHIAGATRQTSRRRARACVENIERLERGLEPLFEVESIARGTTGQR
jgi:phosphoglycerate dehydrogenase-like enzyme